MQQPSIFCHQEKQYMVQNSGNQGKQTISISRKSINLVMRSYGMLRATVALSMALLIPFASTLFQGCSGSSGIDTRRPLTPDDVMRHVEAHNAEMFALSAYGRISIDSKELSNSGNITVRLLKPDSVYMEVTGPFGVSVFKGLVDRRSFTFYNGVDNLVLAGASTASNLRNVLRVGIGFDDIMQILSGTMGFRMQPEGASMQGRLDGGLYFISWSDANGSGEYTVDAKYEAVKHFVRKNSGGEIIEDITFKDFRRQSGRWLSHIIVLERPLNEESITIVYEQIKINDVPMDFAFKIPASARRIDF
jgi:hypothetical protein